MLVILGLLIIAGSILSESNTDRPTPTTAPYTSTSETPIPASVWTTSKLAEGCVITIKNIELMSDCEQALALAFSRPPPLWAHYQQMKNGRLDLSWRTCLTCWTSSRRPPTMP